MVDVCAADWQAIATFVTGGLAVGAAVYVGRKQTEIQRRQTILIENDLKIQLLDKRSACVSSMRKIFYAWEQKIRLSEDEWKVFYALSQDVILLYPKELTQKLDDAMSGIFWANQKYEQARLEHNRGNPEKAKERREAAFAEEDKVMKIMPDLLPELIDYTRVDAWE